MMIDCQENLYMNMVYAWGPGIIEDPPFIKNVNEIKKYLEPGKDSVYIKLLSVNPKNYQSNVYATFVADDIDTVGQIEFDLGESENSFEGVWNSINSEERFYEIILHQNGINIPSTFYYKDKNQLSFTTTGPIKVESYEIEISPAGRISLTNFTLKNYGKTKKVENIKAELTTKNSNLTRYSTKIISFGDILPGNSKTGVSSFSFYTEAGTNSIEFILAIKSNDVNFWTDTVNIDQLTDIDNISETIPLKYELSQNYPNPFNPSTLIKYSIQERRKVTLKVFDLLGKEVAKLVNKEQPQGNYEIAFDGSNLTSGIYLYRLITDEFVDTKKMILLK